MVFLEKFGNIKELTPEEESIFEKNLVWVFGSARSGSTWFARDLLSHNTLRINEPHISEHLALQAGGYNLRFERRVDSMKHLPSYFFSDKFKKTWQFFLRKLILNRIYAETKGVSKKVIIKEVGGLGASDIISMTLPNCKIIMLFRDGRDIIDSLFAAKQKDGFMAKFDSQDITKKNRMQFIDAQSRIWVKLMEDMLKTYHNRPKGSTLSVKYEELRENTFEFLKKNYEFIGIEIDDGELEKLISKYDFENIPTESRGSGKFARSASPGKWKENFSDEEKNLLHEIMIPTLNKLGYD